MVALNDQENEIMVIEVKVKRVSGNDGDRAYEWGKASQSDYYFFQVQGSLKFFVKLSYLLLPLRISNRVEPVNRLLSCVC